MSVGKTLTEAMPPPGWITLIRAANLRDMELETARRIARLHSVQKFYGPDRKVYVDPTEFNAAADAAKGGVSDGRNY